MLPETIRPCKKLADVWTKLGIVFTVLFCLLCLSAFAYVDYQIKMNRYRPYSSRGRAAAVEREVPVASRAADKVLQLPGEVKLSLIYCKPGTFVMGSPIAELGREAGERPHTVKISKGFYLGQYEVTQEQYGAVMSSHPSHFKDSDYLPVESVSWRESQAFCDKLNQVVAGQLPGYKFSLPSEAQWEYACRAGTSSALSSGQDLTMEEGTCLNLDKLAWYGRNSRGRPHLVGQKLPNVSGFYDMHGNVGEWCADYCGPYASSPQVDPLSTKKDLCRVVRGGSWGHYPKSCRSACRDLSVPEEYQDNLGFRLCAQAQP